eukprot:TRINITY_DN27801_c0_g1_i1.p1 TRINITY_DN27801_c0_g1~~TRINITY_DN27801_c0_g1_i1.p1  ORF type:complete len:238 (-),score=22.18 TRINITY_DN27801_c0_g1_i1:49-762(-)
MGASQCTTEPVQNEPVDPNKISAKYDRFTVVWEALAASYASNGVVRSRVDWEFLWNQLYFLPLTQWDGTYDLFHHIFCFLEKSGLILEKEKNMGEELVLAYWMRQLGTVYSGDDLNRLAHELFDQRARKQILKDAVWVLVNQPCRETSDLLSYHPNLMKLNYLLGEFENSRQPDVMKLEAVINNVPIWQLLQCVFYNIYSTTKYSFLDRAWASGYWGACELCLQKGKTFAWILTWLY